MGPVRGGVILGALPVPALAGLCTADASQPAGALIPQTLAFWSAPAGLAVVIVIAAALALRRPWLTWVAAALPLALILLAYLPVPARLQLAASGPCLGPVWLTSATLVVAVLVPFLRRAPA